MEILSLSWYISKTFYQIWVAEVSKSKFMNSPKSLVEALDDSINELKSFSNL